MLKRVIGFSEVNYLYPSPKCNVPGIHGRN